MIRGSWALPLRGIRLLLNDVNAWLREARHPQVTAILGPYPIPAMLGIALISIVISESPLPSWSALNVCLLWTGWAIRSRWLRREGIEELPEHERAHVARGIAIPLYLCVVTDVVGRSLLSLRMESDPAQHLITLMQFMSITLLAVWLLVLTKDFFRGIMETTVLAWILNFMLNLSHTLVDATDQWRESLYNALLAPIGLHIPTWFDPVAELLFWVAAYASIIGITVFAAHQTLHEHLAGDDESDLGARLREMFATDLST